MTEPIRYGTPACSPEPALLCKDYVPSWWSLEELLQKEVKGVRAMREVHDLVQKAAKDANSRWQTPQPAASCDDDQPQTRARALVSHVCRLGLMIMKLLEANPCMGPTLLEAILLVLQQLHSSFDKLISSPSEAEAESALMDMFGAPPVQVDLMLATAFALLYNHAQDCKTSEVDDVKRLDVVASSCLLHLGSSLGMIKLQLSRLQMPASSPTLVDGLNGFTLSRLLSALAPVGLKKAALSAAAAACNVMKKEYIARRLDDLATADSMEITLLALVYRCAQLLVTKGYIRPSEQDTVGSQFEVDDHGKIPQTGHYTCSPSSAAAPIPVHVIPQQPNVKRRRLHTDSELPANQRFAGNQEYVANVRCGSCAREEDVVVIDGSDDEEDEEAEDAAQQEVLRWLSIAGCLAEMTERLRREGGSAGADRGRESGEAGAGLEINGEDFVGQLEDEALRRLMKPFLEKAVNTLLPPDFWKMAPFLLTEESIKHLCRLLHYLASPTSAALWLAGLAAFCWQEEMAEVSMMASPLPASSLYTSLLLVVQTMKTSTLSADVQHSVCATLAPVLSELVFACTAFLHEGLPECDLLLVMQRKPSALGQLLLKSLKVCSSLLANICSTLQSSMHDSLAPVASLSPPLPAPHLAFIHDVLRAVRAGGGFDTSRRLMAAGWIGPVGAALLEAALCELAMHVQSALKTGLALQGALTHTHMDTRAGKRLSRLVHYCALASRCLRLPAPIRQAADPQQTQGATPVAAAPPGAMHRGTSKQPTATMSAQHPASVEKPARRQGHRAAQHPGQHSPVQQSRDPLSQHGGHEEFLHTEHPDVYVQDIHSRSSQRMDSQTGQLPVRLTQDYLSQQAQHGHRVPGDQGPRSAIFRTQDPSRSTQQSAKQHTCGSGISLAQNPSGFTREFPSHHGQGAGISGHPNCGGPVQDTFNRQDKISSLHSQGTGPGGYAQDFISERGQRPAHPRSQPSAGHTQDSMTQFSRCCAAPHSQTQASQHGSGCAPHVSQQHSSSFSPMPPIPPNIKPHCQTPSTQQSGRFVTTQRQDVGQLPSDFMRHTAGTAAEKFEQHQSCQLGKQHASAPGADPVTAGPPPRRLPGLATCGARCLTLPMHSRGWPGAFATNTAQPVNRHEATTAPKTTHPTSDNSQGTNQSSLHGAHTGLASVTPHSVSGSGPYPPKRLTPVQVATKEPPLPQQPGGSTAPQHIGDSAPHQLKRLVPVQITAQQPPLPRHSAGRATPQQTGMAVQASSPLLTPARLGGAILQKSHDTAAAHTQSAPAAAVLRDSVASCSAVSSVPQSQQREREMLHPGYVARGSSPRRVVPVRAASDISGSTIVPHFNHDSGDVRGSIQEERRHGRGMGYTEQVLEGDKGEHARGGVRDSSVLEMGSCTATADGLAREASRVGSAAQVGQGWPGVATDPPLASCPATGCVHAEEVHLHLSDLFVLWSYDGPLKVHAEAAHVVNCNPVQGARGAVLIDQGAVQIEQYDGVQGHRQAWQDTERRTVAKVVSEQAVRSCQHACSRSDGDHQTMQNRADSNRNHDVHGNVGPGLLGGDAICWNDGRGPVERHGGDIHGDIGRCSASNVDNGRGSNVEIRTCGQQGDNLHNPVRGSEDGNSRSVEGEATMKQGHVAHGKTVSGVLGTRAHGPAEQNAALRQDAPDHDVGRRTGTRRHVDHGHLKHSAVDRNPHQACKRASNDAVCGQEEDIPNCIRTKRSKRVVDESCDGDDPCTETPYVTLRGFIRYHNERGVFPLSRYRRRRSRAALPWKLGYKAGLSYIPWAVPEPPELDVTEHCSVAAPVRKTAADAGLSSRSHAHTAHAAAEDIVGSSGLSASESRQVSPLLKNGNLCTSTVRRGQTGHLGSQTSAHCSSNRNYGVDGLVGAESGRFVKATTPLAPSQTPEVDSASPGLQDGERAGGLGRKKMVASSEKSERAVTRRALLAGSDEAGASGGQKTIAVGEEREKSVKHGRKGERSEMHTVEQDPSCVRTSPSSGGDASLGRSEPGTATRLREYSLRRRASATNSMMDAFTYTAHDDIYVSSAGGGKTGQAAGGCAGSSAKQNRARGGGGSKGKKKTVCKGRVGKTKNPYLRAVLEEAKSFGQKESLDDLDELDRWLVVDHDLDYQQVLATQFRHTEEGPAAAESSVEDEGPLEIPEQLAESLLRRF